MAKALSLVMTAVLQQHLVRQRTSLLLLRGPQEPRTCQLRSNPQQGQSRHTARTFVGGKSRQQSSQSVTDGAKVLPSLACQHVVKVLSCLAWPVR